MNGTPTWLANCGGGSAANLVVKPGDTVVWKATAATHGVVFDTEALARTVLDFESGGGLPRARPAGGQG